MKKILSTAAFFDTSVLVPVLYENHRHYLRARGFLADYTNRGLILTVSPQNILEISTVLNGKYKVASSIVSQLIDKFLDDPLVRVIYPNPSVINRFLEMLKVAGGTYYTDVFLAATALEYGFDTIVTNDRDFEKIKEMRVYNPFI